MQFWNDSHNFLLFQGWFFGGGSGFFWAWVFLFCLSFCLFSQWEFVLASLCRAQTGYDNPAQKNTTITVSLTNLTVTHAVQKCGKLYSTHT